MRISVLLSAIVFIAACSSTQSLQPSLGPMVADGSAVLISREGETLLLLRTTRGDGAADHLFHVWSDRALLLNMAYRDAHVEFTGSSLRVLARNEKTLLTFIVAGHPAPAAADSGALSATAYELTGLSHEIGARAQRYVLTNTSRSPAAALASAGGSPLNAEPSFRRDCYSGGPGAISAA